VHSVFGKIKFWWFKTQQLILGTGSAIWWLTEPHYDFAELMIQLKIFYFIFIVFIFLFGGGWGAGGGPSSV
jgi:hypothetical protein